MITLPSVLQKVMESNNLAGLKPFAYLFRNKWDSVSKKYALESTPIDISEFIVKPNTLSMTLDVNEVAQYNANNVTITLEDTDNRFVEGTSNSYFPAGYQIYGSRVVLYYGLDNTNQTSIFAGVIKDLPTYKPENYQVDVKLVSPLEMLKDIEAKDFSDKFTGETLTYKSTDSDGHKVYNTSGKGVGGFDAVYANGTKLFEGVDYETDQMNALGLPAIVKIINSDLYSSTITADYYTWKTGLSVEQIVAGLVGLAGYDSGTEDIRSVVWNSLVREQRTLTAEFSIGYKQNGNNFIYTGNEVFRGGVQAANQYYYRFSKFPTNFEFELTFFGGIGTYFLGDFNNGQPYNGIGVEMSATLAPIAVSYFEWFQIVNGVRTNIGQYTNVYVYKIIRTNGVLSLVVGGSTIQTSADFTGAGDNNEMLFSSYALSLLKNSALQNTDNGNSLNAEGVYFNALQKNAATNVWASLQGTIDNEFDYTASYKTSQDGVAWSQLAQIQIGSDLGLSDEYIQFIIYVTNPTNGADISNASVDVLTNSLVLQLVNLSGKTVLEALQDFALISGYEFGVDRQGVFFFRPRVQITNPIYTLGADELVKIDTVKRNLSDFFTKLTLTFAQVPLEFYANTGERPTLVDKYGIINKEIDKPDIVNYDNPELAQAIGPQLLEVYSSLPNVIQVTGKLNLSLELADIVQVDRNYNLVQPDSASDYDKYVNQQTYYRACKITGMNYNFEKKQITYTLRDVSNSNNVPYVSAYGFVYDFPIRLGTRK